MMILYLIRIKYNKSCPACKIDNVPQEDIVKGYEYEKDKYIVIDDEEFESIKTEKDRSIQILQFVDATEIDPLFYYKSYYLTPDQSDKAFNLLRTAIHQEGKVAIGKTVLSTKENLVAIREKDGSLILSLMFFAQDIKPAPKSLIENNVNENELNMALTLIQGMTKEFNPEEYKNEYQDRLKELINQKIQGNEVIVQQPQEHTNVINLVDALQASLQSIAINRPKKKTPKKKKAVLHDE